MSRAWQKLFVAMKAHGTVKQIGCVFVAACALLFSRTALSQEGVVITDVFAIDDACRGDILPDGSLVNGGTGDVGYFCATKHSPDGTLDTSWGDGGAVSYFWGHDINTRCSAGATAQPDGKVILGGYYHVFSNRGNAGYFALIRYDASGKIDKTFNKGKPVKTYFGGGKTNLAGAKKVIILPDNKILAIGWFFDRVTPYKIAMARYLANGALDSSFGDGGMVIAPRDYSNPLIEAFALQGDKILVGGGSRFSPSWHPYSYDHYFIVARFNADGSPDTSFGVAGETIIDHYVGNTVECATGMAVLPDNKIVMTGYVGNEAFLADTGSAIVRLNADGSLDSSFGDGGITFQNLFPVVGEGEQVTAGGMLPDGRIVAAVTHEYLDGTQNAGLAIYSPDGDFEGYTEGPNGRPTDLKIDSLGDVVLFGDVDAPDGSDYMLMRFLYGSVGGPPPILDLTFGW